MHHFGVTPNHPFYCQIKGWRPLYQAYGYCGDGFGFETIDGSQIGKHLCSELYATDDEHLGYRPDDRRWFEEFGTLFDIRPDHLLATREYSGPLLTEVEYKTPMLATVYNIEVQDNHTYYVGELGIWVHNKTVDPLENIVLVRAGP